MRRAGDDAEIGRDTRVPEAHRVVDVLVPEAVGAAGDHQRRREPREIVGTGRGRVRGHVVGPYRSPR